MFSIQLDTTQDISSKEQCALVLRYVTDLIHEKLIAVVNCEASTGEHFVKMVKDTLENVGLDLQKCIGNTTDLAANMQGKYKGFSTLLSAESPKQVQTWCYARVLNLVLTDTTGIVVPSKVFGCFGNPDRALFVDLIITLKRIEEDDSFNDKA